MIQNCKTYLTANDLVIDFAKIIVEKANNCENEKFNIAISGGNSPNILFSELAEKYSHEKVWNKTHFWWVDERMVAKTSSESNYGNANNLLFSKLNIPDENIHPVNGLNTPETEAINYSNQILNEIKLTNKIPCFDIIILGIGDDGHTASIFPQQTDLFYSENICEVSENPYTGQARITLTFKTINNAKSIYFLVTGSNKANKIAEIFNTEKQQILPASFIKPTNGDICWLLDADAAKLIDI